MNVKRNKFIDDEALVSDADVSNSSSVEILFILRVHLDSYAS